MVRAGRRGYGDCRVKGCEPPPPTPHRAVASQLVPRGTWRHLVPVSTVVTVEGCGLCCCSAPTGESTAPTDDRAPAEEEAADARLQGVAGVGIGAQSLRGMALAAAEGVAVVAVEESVDWLLICAAFLFWF